MVNSEIFSESERIAKAFLEACQHGTHPSYRARINIIGHSGAGKTSLTRRLLGQKFQKEEESTDGIETHRIEFNVNESPLDHIVWSEAELDPVKLVAIFSEDVLERSAQSADQQGQQKQGQEQPKIGQETIDELRIYSEKKEDEKHAVKGREVPAEVIPSNRPHYSENTDTNQEAEETIKGVLRLWDFGGQTEFYTTHHMFLDADAINIIVMDISKPLKEKLCKDNDKVQAVGVPQTAEEFFCYWLRSIQTKASQKNVEQNILLVLTHRDIISGSQPSSYIQDFVHDVKQVINTNNLPQVEENHIYIVDNNTGNQKEFNNVKVGLLEMLEKMDWKSERPVKWLKLEADMRTVIDQKTAKPCKYLTQEEVMMLSQKLLMNDMELEPFLSYLHSKGDIIWFPDSGLRHLITLDPQWLVDMFKILITSEEFLHKRSLRDEALQLLQHGTVTFGALQKFWSGNDAEFLAKLLQNYNLILPLQKSSAAVPQKYLVPCMLPQPKDPVVLLKTKPFEHMAQICKSKHQSAHQVLLPIGTFAKLIAVCSKRYHLREEHLSDKFASFELQHGLILTIQQTHGSAITVSIWCLLRELQENPMSLLLETWFSLREALTQCRVPLSSIFDLLCPHWKPGCYCCLVKVEEGASGTTGGHHSLQPIQAECSCHGKQLGTVMMTPGQFYCIAIIFIQGTAWSLIAMASHICMANA